MSIAYIFPGQGSQYVGMGKSLAEKFPKAKEIFDRADQTLGFSLSEICFTGDEARLKQTENTQPAIFTHSVAALSLMNGAAPSMTAGHSLGEYTALYAAGAIEFEEALRLVRLRGELMQHAGIEQPGTMAAIVGLEEEALNAVCEEASEAGIVQAANYNSPGQIVISGSVEGVHKAMALAKERGAKLVKELVVSGAFHSPLMASAREKLTHALAKASIKKSTVPVYMNVTAKSTREPEEIRTLLAEQLTKPVRWNASVGAMANDGATEFIEIGPGKVLQGLIKRIVPTAATRGIDKAEDITS